MLATIVSEETGVSPDDIVVVSGDTSQTDLPPHTKSGLIDALSRLRNVEGFARVALTVSDIVRHRLVQDIVRAYEEGPKKKK